MDTMNASKKLFKAAKGGNIEGVAALLEVPGCNPNVTVKLKYSNSGVIDAWTPLHVAANNGFVEIVQLLLDRGAKVNVTTPKVGATPLHQAAACNRAKVIELLLDQGADVTIRNKTSGATPLHSAAMFGSSSAVCKLLDSGANIDDRTVDHGATALHISAAYDHYETTEKLLKHSAPVNALNMHGETPAHLAAWYTHVNIMRLLISHDCDVTLEDENGRTVRKCVQESERYDGIQSRHEITRLINDRLQDSQNGKTDRSTRLALSDFEGDKDMR